MAEVKQENLIKKIEQVYAKYFTEPGEIESVCHRIDTMPIAFETQYYYTCTESILRDALWFSVCSVKMRPSLLCVFTNKYKQIVTQVYQNIK